VRDPLLWSRRLVRTTLARTVGPFLPADRVLVVGYHRVVERFESEAPRTLASSLVSQRMLERHLDWIGRDHEFVSLDELGYRLQVRERVDRPMAAITFDDGYRDVYEHAFPMLIRKGIPAAFFLVTDKVGTSSLQTHDQLHALLRLALRRWERPADAVRLRFEAISVPEARRLALPDSTDPFVWTRLLLTALSARSLARVIADLQE